MGGKRISAGDKFGRLTVVEMTYKESKSGRRRAFWVCVCDCGGSNTVDSGNLRNGNTRWCSLCASKFKSSHRRKHGHSQHADGRNKATKEYSTWSGMKGRCLNKKDTRYFDYGGRGISICREWIDSFESFLSDMGVAPSADHQIDRIDNNGNYEPDNCKWASRTENSNNKRNNYNLTINGETKTLANWEKFSGINQSTIKRRVTREWSSDKLLLPVSGTGNRAKKVSTPDGLFDSVKKAALHYGMGQTWIYERLNGSLEEWYYIK